MPDREEQVLAIPAATLFAGGMWSGVATNLAELLPRLLDPAALRFLPRGAAELDPTYRQLVPYAVLRRGGEVFHYQRAGGGEGRLRGRRSIGIGGHVNDGDGPAASAVRAGFLRELHEEVSLPDGWTDRLAALLHDPSTPVGAVHVGLVYLVECPPGEVRPREAGMADWGWATVADLVARRGEFETWSQLALDSLDTL